MHIPHRGRREGGRAHNKFQEAGAEEVSSFCCTYTLSDNHSILPIMLSGGLPGFAGPTTHDADDHAKDAVHNC